MKGYLGQPEKTAEVIRDGWYATGDIARVDEDGFIQITGRESRFSKIGGEMVPHMRIEEELLKIIGQDEEEPIRAVITAVPDPRKGERLIVVHSELGMTPDEVCEALAAAGLSNLWIPSTDSFLRVDELPILGTGKLDLKGVAVLAREHFAVGTS
jgi:acyl-[acyl-carrier-protein]-phospholipid O-acyltransferase/long-chain-fatty-acid--[acyl-carrier-protein] ligase